MIMSVTTHERIQDNVERTQVILNVENLSKVYVSSMGKVVSLRDVSFKVNKGEFVSVVGPSGSGKSTLLNMIGALDRPSSGRVYINLLSVRASRASMKTCLRFLLLCFRLFF
jgi:putative ABC transport system ATP-binding protein